MPALKLGHCVMSWCGQRSLCLMASRAACALAICSSSSANRQRSGWVVSLLDMQPADQVLEIGFGPGLTVAELARAGAGHVYGIDHSCAMLRQASRRNAAAIRAGRVTLIRAAADQIPPAVDGPFDAILAINSLGFWPAPAERLAELRGRLAPGGRMAIASQPRCPGATADTSRSAAREIEDLLRVAGFTHLSTQSLPLSPPVACVLAASPAPDTSHIP
jgi:SAM-dependent methyltransferase